MKFGEFIHQLFGGRDYKDIDGVPYVKEGFGSWERLDDIVSGNILNCRIT